MYDMDEGHDVSAQFLYHQYILVQGKKYYNMVYFSKVTKIRRKAQ